MSKRKTTADPADPAGRESVAMNKMAKYLFQAAQKPIQTLAGRSARKTFIGTCGEEMQGWANGLYAVQRTNFETSFRSPDEEEPLALYKCVNEKEPRDDPVKLKRATDLLSCPEADPNSECELHPKFGTTPVMEAAFHGHVKVRESKNR